MTKYILLLFVTAVASLSLSAQRVKYNFNSDWIVYLGDDPGNSSEDHWKKVTLPYAWNEDDAFKKDIVDLRTGIAWYRKHFIVPNEHKDKKVFIEFEGVRQAGQIFINGKFIGLHENGAMAFGFDITDHVLFGEDNIISVRVDNDWDYKEQATNTKFQWEDRNFNANYGGITKNVFLHVTDKLYQTLPLYSNLGTTGVYIYADNFNIKGKTAVIHAESEIRNETGKDQQVQYEVKVFDINNKLIKNFKGESLSIAANETKKIKASSPITGLNYWSWGYGYLYRVQTILLVNGNIGDSVNTKTGFRKTEFKNGMIYLNDRVIQIHGYAQRTSNEWPAIGISVPAWLSDYSNSLMVQGNGNLVRWMHITPWKQDVESCDRVGLMQAMPAGDAERDVDGVRWDQRKALMRDAIIYNKNNPSIIFYECGNESISEQHMSDMKAIRDQYDANGGRAIGSREMLDSKVAEYGGEMLYVNKSADIPMWATEYSRDEGLRKYWDDYSPPYHKDGDGPLYRNESARQYNRNMESHAIENVIRWYDYWKERPGTGKRVNSGGVNIIFSETNTHHRGAENYRRSGEVDAMRIIKQNYYANKIMWNGWVDVEKQGIHIIGHWSYKSGVKKDIYVISSADKVELRVNGRSLGFGTQSYRFLYTFKGVKWEPGFISAIGYDNNSKVVCTAIEKTAGEPAAIRISRSISFAGMKADGHDLALVEVEVVDKNNFLCPVATNMIHFELEGPAEWRGGMAQGPDNYILSKDLPVEGGVNRVLIRSTTTPGTITITATSEGLKGAKISLTTNAVNVVNGLSKTLPGDGLISHTWKGPTPLTPSFKQSRNAINIISAVAGANSDSAFASYDDNELSDWVNDGKLSTAWIEYELEREAVVSEVNLKLNNFRTRIYPLQITVDGKVVFSDTTQRGLGYFNVVCKPQKGKRVRIQLMQSSAVTGETSTEVSGKKLDDGVSRNEGNSRGSLSIIEAEIYEKAGK
jgi:hypothetical protein